MGTLAPGSFATIRRQGQAMSLNNTGDTVSLVAPDGVEVQTVSYGPVAEGELVRID